VIFSVWLLYSLTGEHQYCGGKLKKIEAACAPETQLRQLVASFMLHRPGFSPRSVYVGFVVGKVALGQVFSQYFIIPWQLSFQDMLHFFHLLSGWYSGPFTVLRYSLSPHTKRGTHLPDFMVS
jgi:hypothetical protein